MIWLDAFTSIATTKIAALSIYAIRHFEWCSIFPFFFIRKGWRKIMSILLHPSTTATHLSKGGSLSGLESLWIWHRNQDYQGSFFFYPYYPLLLPLLFCFMQFCSHSCKTKWFLIPTVWTLQQPKKHGEETPVVLLNKPIFYGKYKVDALALLWPTWPTQPQPLFSAT